MSLDILLNHVFIFSDVLLQTTIAYLIHSLLLGINLLSSLSHYISSFIICLVDKDDG